MYWLINWILTKTGSQILSIKGECTSPFWNVLIIDLSNYSANLLLEIIQFLTVPAKVDLCTNETVLYHKIHKPLKLVYVDIHHILDLNHN